MWCDCPNFSVGFIKTPVKLRGEIFNHTMIWMMIQITIHKMFQSNLHDIVARHILRCLNITVTSHERHSVSNYRPLNCLFDRLFNSKEKNQNSTWPIFCDRDPPAPVVFPSQNASNVEKVSFSRSHNERFMTKIMRSRWYFNERYWLKPEYISFHNLKNSQPSHKET